ncbi:Gag1p NDAI_0J02390 [Naumovozyma dairenensis CBS 421]|uniref:Uncharacterized protein n=1 Tax=Naumovozyma dairenensis (strain ATCC 10597 / BCRC 20456 / CBS 421 / NBRC 0211 / NRRL Y-12639) TaxID=1071378 RepID=G0WH53_NAUDC|nr:hypothetical protein NDAI_0J02390 [Naumovozyma dairenensis CBS 421]CCD27131.1 hypothetical protein NDAI_0J02390 [Naumovozyma dairenensis CBS 421]
MISSKHRNTGNTATTTTITATQTVQTNPKKSSVKSTLSNTFHKWKTTLRKITHETLNSLDESSSSDDKIDALFHANAASNTDENLAKLERLEKKETALLTQNNTEQLITKDDHDAVHAPTPITSNTTTTLQDGDDDKPSEEEEEETYETYNSELECAKLRSKCESENKPFIEGHLIWEHRRELWNKPRNDIKIDQAEIASRRKVFQSIPEQYYPRIYKKLVVDDKPLREPLNLEDAMKIINAGWHETKKWANAANGLP